MKYSKKNKKNKKIGFVVAVAVILLIMTGMFLLSGSGNSSKVIDNITIEAGTPVPEVGEFFLSPKTAGSYVTDISGIDTNKIGTTEIEIEIRGKKYISSLTIKDTTPPTGKSVELYIFPNSEINPDGLVTDIYDVTEVICKFETQPDFDRFGWQDVAVILTDEGNNITKIESKIYIFEVADELAVEIGTDNNITIRDFILNYIETDGLYINTDEINFSALGVYPVVLELNNYITESVVKIADTIPPTGEPVELYIFKDSEVNPDDFVTNIQDETEVTCEFKTPPDFDKLGWQRITVILTDEGDNKTEIKSRVYIIGVIGELVIEAGTVSNISTADFMLNFIETDSVFIDKADEINFLVPGLYPVVIKTGAYETPAVVKIQDTTPPKARVKSCRTYKNKSIPAENFVSSITDVSPVTVRYKTRPDFSAEGNQTVYIILEDAYNNISEYTAQLTVIFDTTPPVISGELDKTIVEGGTISYRTGITVTDDYDTNVQLVIDSSQVNLNKAGSYTVIYSATDESGNKTTVKGTITVSAIDMNLVNQMADEILAKIIDNSMTKYEKARAIFNWVHGKMRYSSSLSPREIPQAAYNCFSRGSGDCYTYMAGSRVLLTRAGIENRTVQRIAGAATPHYWNLVNTGGGWYHFDVCPTPSNAVTISERFMFTESQARRYTRIIPNREHYYDYDKSTVPEVVEGYD